MDRLRHLSDFLNWSNWWGEWVFQEGDVYWAAQRWVALVARLEGKPKSKGNGKRRYLVTAVNLIYRALC